MDEARSSERRDWPDVGWTVLLCAETEYAHTHADFKLYRHVAYTVPDDEPLFWRKGSNTNMDPVEEVESAEIAGEMTVKWDGCGQIAIEGLHICEREHVEALGVVLLRIYDWAREVGMDQA